MARVFDKARELFLSGQLNWTAGNWRCVLLAESFVPDFAAEFLDEIGLAPRIAVSDLITGRTATDGYANSSPIAFPLLVSTLQVSQAVVFKDTADEATSQLVYYMDQDSIIGIPFVPLGVDYFIYPNAVEGGFFRL